jgi:hypothetical protein
VGPQAEGMITKWSQARTTSTMFAPHHMEAGKTLESRLTQ